MLKSLTKLAILVSFAALPLAAAPANAEDLVVQYDQAHLLKLDQPAANIIVGNPSIADVTLKSTKLLVITGKTFGVTNLMILNDEEKVIFNARILVKADDSKVVTLIRGDAKNTYACVPTCEPVLKVGDDEKFYQNVAATATAKMKISEGGPQATQAGN